MVEPGMEGINIARRARKFREPEWKGESFMAIGTKDPVLGLSVMNQLRKSIRRCPEPMVLEEAGHFVQEWGEPIAHAALKLFGDLN